jgi:hypothetical protein
MSAAEDRAQHRGCRRVALRAQATAASGVPTQAAPDGVKRAQRNNEGDIAHGSEKTRRTIGQMKKPPQPTFRSVRAPENSERGARIKYSTIASAHKRNAFRGISPGLLRPPRDFPHLTARRRLLHASWPPVRLGKRLILGNSAVVCATQRLSSPPVVGELASTSTPHTAVSGTASGYRERFGFTTKLGPMNVGGSDTLALAIPIAA